MQVPLLVWSLMDDGDHKMENTEEAAGICVSETSEAMTRSANLFNMQKKINERKKY